MARPRSERSLIEPARLRSVAGSTVSSVPLTGADHAVADFISLLPEQLRDRVLLTEIEVSRVLGVPRKQLQHDRWCGKGLPFHKLGRAVRYHVRDIAAAILAGRRTSTSDQVREVVTGKATNAVLYAKSK